MLCQRVAKLYLLRAWIPRSEATLAALVNADAQMRRALEGLAASAAPEVVPELQLAQNQYAFLAPAIERLRHGRGAPADAEAVAKTSDNLLEVMERIARLQEAGA